MALKAGIIGLPNVGKSTLFNAITNSQIEAANYPFATIDPNIGVVELPDERLSKLAKIVLPNKVVPAAFEFIDIAGLVKGASKGEGLGNKFLANIREVDAIVQVVRIFEDQNITHVSGHVDPLRDMSIINLELLFADMETISNIISRTKRKAENGDKFALPEYNLAKKFLKAFEQEIPARKLDLNASEYKLAKNWHILTMKPMLYVGNVHEKYVANPEQSELYLSLEAEVKKQGAIIIGISAQIEFELSQLHGEDKEIFLKDLGITESGLDKITRASFDLLNLATFFTAGKIEVKAWTFHKGDTAPQCAGIIHTDFERGFIRAEIISYNDYVNNKGEQGAKDAGKTRLEGKEYIMKDGDIVHFRFNV